MENDQHEIDAGAGSGAVFELMAAALFQAIQQRIALEDCTMPDDAIVPGSLRVTLVLETYRRRVPEVRANVVWCPSADRLPERESETAALDAAQEAGKAAALRTFFVQYTEAQLDALFADVKQLCDMLCQPQAASIYKTQCLVNTTV